MRTYRPKKDCGRGLDWKFGLISGLGSCLACVLSLTFPFAYYYAASHGLDPVAGMLSFDLVFYGQMWRENLAASDFLYVFIGTVSGFWFGHRDSPDDDRLGFFFDLLAGKHR